MPNPFTYLQLQTNDPVKAEEFYKQLFDWTLEDSSTSSALYKEIITVEGIGGGIMMPFNSDTPSHWLPYVQVDDIKVSTEKARILGAKINLQPTEAPGKGFFSIITDPTGAALALWQPL